MKPWASAAWMGAQMALHRLSGRATLLATAGAVVFATLAAWAERHTNANTAPDFALRGAAFGLAIPLAALAVVTAALGRNRLEDALAAVATLGGNRRAAALGTLAATSLVASVVGLAAATTTAIVAHGQLTGAAASDTLTAAWIGAVSGAAYGFYYGFASCYGKRGGGRIVALLADLILGPLAGTAAVVFPRAHSLNLLGAAPVFELPQAASTALLIVMSAVFAALAALRTRA